MSERLDVSLELDLDEPDSVSTSVFSRYLFGDGGVAGSEGVWARRVLCPGILRSDFNFLKGAAIGERVLLCGGVCCERLRELLFRSVVCCTAGFVFAGSLRLRLPLRVREEKTEFMFN